MADVAIFADTRDAEQWLARLQKKVSQVEGGTKTFAAVLANVVFQDIISHYENQEGSKGPWRAWSKMYAEHMEKIGKGNNKILQDSGHLRQAFAPGNFRSVSEGILWFNPAKTKGGFPYAAAHDEGGDDLPKRDFMWLSDGAQEKIAEITLNYILEGN